MSKKKMKKIKLNKKVKKLLNRYQYEIIIGILSIVALIIGTLAVGFLKSFIIVAIIDLLLIVPTFINRKPVKGKHVKTNSKSAAKTDTKKKSIHSSKEEEKKQTSKPKKKRKWWKRLLILFFILMILGILAFGGFMAYIISTAPKFDPNNLYRKESTIVYDKNGKEWAKLGIEKREKVKYSALPEILVDAIVATEDSRFFEHNGFDLPRFLKASIGQALGRDAGGASTLTMQVSKNNYTSTTASGFEGIKRKFTDIYMSIFQIEKNYSKEKILEFYVNQPYLGSGAYGVEQACQTYFGKSVSDINLAEAALIAGLFQAPNAYDPYLNPEASESRRQTVLYLMKRHGYINDSQYKAAKSLNVEKLLKKSSTSTTKYQAFLDTVIQDVIDKTDYSPYDVAMEIYTTLDPEKQGYLDDIMNGKEFTWENDAVNAGISVIDVKTGALVAVGAGRNRTGERQYNTATMINRQIGSTAKPLYDYAMGFEKKGWSTYQPFADEPHGYSSGTSIDNWDRTFSGFMTLRRALAESRNIPALKAFQANSKKDIKNFVESVGLSPQYEGDILHEAHALGGYNGESPLSLSAAYSSFASGGYYTKPYTFTKIVYRETGKTFEPDTKRKKVLSEETAYMMNHVLIDAAEYGIGRNVTDNGATFAAKTGTSNYPEQVLEQYNFPSNTVNDLWVSGYSPDYAIAVWYGYNEINKNYVSTTNTGEHRRLFLTVANEIFKPGSKWSKPAGVSEVAIENYTYPAKLPSANTPDDLKITELFKKGAEPTEVSGRFNSLGNVKNAKASINDNEVTITWDKMNPTSQDVSWVNQLFGDSGEANKFIGKLKSYNNSHLGTFGYKVYAKESDGTLSLIKFVTSNSITFTVRSSDPSTYVIKSGYSIRSNCDSKGVEVEVDLDGVKAEIDAQLNGSSNMSIGLNSTYTENGFTVTEDGSDVTNGTNVSISVKSNHGKNTTTSSLNEVPALITTDVETVYTITYTISYGSFTKELTRTVTVS